MSRFKDFGLFWYDFIVGDDWIMAVGVIFALGITALLAHNKIVAWWIMPLAAVSVLVISLWRAGKKKAPS